MGKSTLMQRLALAVDDDANCALTGWRCAFLKSNTQ